MEKMTQNAKEQDYESELADHGVRKYDYDIGRFTSTDVLFEKYYGWTPYQYSANNPINLLDWNGKLPMDPFNSLFAAAHDFGKNYSIVSFAFDREVSTSFYKYIDENGEGKWTYAIPYLCGWRGSKPEWSTIEQPGFEKVAEGHTHGPHSKEKINENDFSPGDKDDGTIYPLFVFTRTGLGKLFTPETGEIITKFGNLPKDKGNSEENQKTLKNHPEKRPVLIFYFQEGASGYNQKPTDSKKIPFK